MPLITAPVGPNQPNQPADVTIVQQALARHADWLRGVAVPQATGRFDADTAAAITTFQREAAALKIADGVVSPRGFTVSQLARDTIPKPKHRLFLAMCWAHPNDTLCDADYAAAAQRLSCEVAAVRAVADTEAKDSPWDEVGRPTILVERHKFSAHTGGRFNATHADISNPRYGGYGASRTQYDRLRRAAVLDEQAAPESTSRGLFQILGENHQQAGYGSVEAFVTAMTLSRTNHLNAFVSFVAANPGMLRAIQTKDWATFARRYNGPKFADNDYDGKMRRAYERLSPPAAGGRTAAPARAGAAR